MRQAIAATFVAVVVSLLGTGTATAAVPDPHVGLNDALRMAYTVQWDHAIDAQRRQERTIATTTGAKSTAASNVNPNQSDMGASSWDAVAACESGDDWSTNTGNGYFGGLQMNMAFWRAHGGTVLAPRPDLASKADQITVAERAGSRAPWPICGRR